MTSKKQLRDDLDNVWGLLPVNEVRFLQEYEPETVERLAKNHQKVAHKTIGPIRRFFRSLIDRWRFFWDTNGQGY